MAIDKGWSEFRWIFIDLNKHQIVGSSSESAFWSQESPMQCMTHAAKKTPHVI